MTNISQNNLSPLLASANFSAKSSDDLKKHSGENFDINSADIKKSENAVYVSGITSVATQNLIDAQEYSSKTNNSEETSNEQSAREKFLEYVKKPPIERLREQILEKLGLTEESLSALPPEEQAKIEEKIAEEIEKQIKESAGINDKSPSNIIA